ncbi:MAG: hypothetical protein LBC80_10765 [Treponema sp.]|jgi:hypothetical protein|nr:hypothetical protein [Treponema sp.]
MKIIINVILVFCFIFLSCTVPESEHIERTLYDPDLHGWKTASWTPFGVGARINGFAYGNVNGRDTYIAVSGNGIIGWSYNGDFWHKAAELPIHFNAVAFGNGVFVAVGNAGRYAWSFDGKHWNVNENLITGYGSENINGIAWGQDNFVVVGGNSNIAVTTSITSDGLGWDSRRPSANATTDPWNDVAFDSIGGRFYIVGNNGRRGWNGNVATSSVWNIQTGGEHVGNSNITKVTVGRRGATSSGSETIGIGILFSNNRVAIVLHPDFNFGYYIDADLAPLQFIARLDQWGNPVFEDHVLFDITWGGGYFLVSGNASLIGHWNSANPSNFSGRFWSSMIFQEFDRWPTTSIEALNGRFFVGNEGGKIGYSK